MRAKFTVKSKREYLGYHNGNTNTRLVEISASPVGDAKETNKSWSAATPSGELKMSISNPAAVDFFELGKEYYLDFTPVENEG
jgi:hypothetical protein